ncbi:hypothetical protein GWI33_001514 [Rhynchophorus ferrugineus]|uniref:Uncharacterized protein n=1 Tax=Rhynchophorus ferrugineus TaxID=354439 RepID=A0A834IL81_RHYFE|nr:hypothetical protein GWI33_001514 [Rhynchophorus ferrugineus]
MVFFHSVTDLGPHLTRHSNAKVADFERLQAPKVVVLSVTSPAILPHRIPRFGNGTARGRRRKNLCQKQMEKEVAFYLGYGTGLLRWSIDKGQSKISMFYSK